MRHYLYIFLPAIIVVGMAIFIATQDEHATENHAAYSAQAAKSRKLSSNAEADHKQSEDYIYDPKRDTPSWYEFFRWPNGTTTWAILLTLVVIIEQTNQTRISASATKDSVEASYKSIALQETAFSQWVEIGGWEKFTRGIEVDSNNAIVVFRFNIMNPTKFVMTLGEIDIKRRAVTDNFSVNKILPPDKAYPSDFSLDLDAEDVARYFRNSLVFGLEIAISYEDVLRAGRTQKFLCLISCGESRLDIEELANRAETNAT